MSASANVNKPIYVPQPKAKVYSINERAVLNLREQAGRHIRDAEAVERHIPDAHRDDQREREANLISQGKYFRAVAAGLEAGIRWLEALEAPAVPVAPPEPPKVASKQMR